MGSPQRACQVDLRSKVKHDWVLCRTESDRRAEFSRRMGDSAATKGRLEAFGGGGGKREEGRGEQELIVTGIDRLDSRPAGRSYPAVLGERAKAWWVHIPLLQVIVANVRC